MYDEMLMGEDKSKDDRLRREIDERVRDLYRDTLEEGVPDRFASLLERLRKSKKDTDQ